MVQKELGESNMKLGMEKAALSQGIASKVIALTFLVLFGAGLVYSMGFAHSHLLHNAAHDVRHSAGFPCH